MAVVDLQVTDHSLELFTKQAEGGDIMVCSCGWDSGVVERVTARSMGRMHLAEAKDFPFHGAWLQTATNRERTERRHRLLRRGKEYGSYFRSARKSSAGVGFH